MRLQVRRHQSMPQPRMDVDDKSVRSSSNFSRRFEDLRGLHAQATFLYYHTRYHESNLPFIIFIGSAEDVAQNYQKILQIIIVNNVSIEH